MNENEWNVRFYDDGKLMKSVDVFAHTIRQAVTQALAQVEGFASWNELAVEQYREKGEDDIS